MVQDDVWIAVTDFTSGQDWVQVGATSQHFLGKSHVKDCGGYPSWGDSKPSYAANQVYMIWKSNEEQSDLMISATQIEKIKELIGKVHLNNGFLNESSDDTFPVGVFSDMTRSYMVKEIRNELLNNY